MVTPSGTPINTPISAGTPNTGIFFPSPTVIAFSAGGNLALSIDSTGNVYLPGTLLSNSFVFGNLVINQGLSAGSLTSNSYGYFTQNVVINSVNAAVSTATGALVVVGGTAIGGDIYSAGKIVTAGSLQIASITSNGAVQAAGTVTAGSINSNGSIVGASIISNGTVQAAGAIAVGSVISNGAVQAAGSISSGSYGLFAGNVTINGANSSINTVSGALKVVGGVGIGDNLNVGGSRSIFSNYVGIGTSTPTGINSNVFSVYGATQLYGNVILSNLVGGTSGIYFADGTFQATAGTPPGAAASAGNAGSVQFSGGSGAFFADQLNFFWDNVTKGLGLGTITPYGRLDVAGNAGFRNNVTVGGGFAAQSISSNTSITATGNVIASYVYANVSIVSDGQLVANTLFSNGAITSANVSVVGSLAPTVGIYSPFVGQLGLATNSSQRLLIDANGNVGIGTSTMNGALTVFGGNVGIGTATPAYGLAVSGQINSNNFQSDPIGAIQTFANSIPNPYTVPANRNALSVGNLSIGSTANVTVPSGSRWVIL